MAQQVFIDAVANRSPRIVMMAELDLPTGVSRVWSGSWHLTTNDGRLWEPVHEMGSVSIVASSSATVSENFRLQLMRAYTRSGNEDLDGFHARMRGDFNNGNIRGRYASLLVQAFSNSLGQLGRPHVIAKGKMSAPEVSISNGVASISVDVAGVLADGSRPPHGMVTDEDQRARYPGDEMLEFVSQLPEKARRTRWPR